jgi:IstB-like ATP binding protein
LRRKVASYSPTQNCNGKIHPAATIGLALVENGRRVPFMPTGELVQRLQITRRELRLKSAIAKLDKYHLLVLDDIADVGKDRTETSVLFELIGSRYQRPLIADPCQSGPSASRARRPDQAMTSPPSTASCITAPSWR